MGISIIRYVKNIFLMNRGWAGMGDGWVSLAILFIIKYEYTLIRYCEKNKKINVKKKCIKLKKKIQKKCKNLFTKMYKMWKKQFENIWKKILTKFENKFQQKFTEIGKNWKKKMKKKWKNWKKKEQLEKTFEKEN